MTILRPVVFVFLVIGLVAPMAGLVTPMSHPSSNQQYGVANSPSLDSSNEGIPHHYNGATATSLPAPQQSPQQNVTIMANSASRNMTANINIVKLEPGQIATPAGIVIDASQLVNPNGKIVSPQINGTRLNPTIINGWTENTGWTYSGSITFMSAKWRVPPSPTTNGGLVYWFPGMQSGSRIVQPVLSYGYSGNYWELTNWWCCSPATHTNLIRVNPGDLIYGSMSRAGNTWTIHAADLTTGNAPNDLVLTDSDTYAWAATALEMYNINTCDQISGGVSYESITLQSGSTTLSANWGTSVNYSVCGLGSDDVIVDGSSQTILNTADPHWDWLTWSSGSIPLGGYFDITLRVKNFAGTAYSQTAVLSFPSAAASVQITSTDMAQKNTYLAGSTLSGCYSTCSVVLSYPIAVGSSSLKAGQTGYITVRVYPNQVGDFNVYFKTLALVHGVASDFAANWDPTSGSQDQQSEQANTLSLTVWSGHVTKYYDISCASPGTTVTMRADVQNTGSSAFPSGTQLWFYVTIPSGAGSYVGYTDVSGQVPGTTTWGLGYVPAASGSYSYKADLWLYSGGKYTQISPFFTPAKAFAVAGASGSVMTYYDVSGASPGATVSLRADVQNTGCGAFPAGAEVWFYVINPAGTGSYVGYKDASGQPVGTSTYSYSWTVPSSATIGSSWSYKADLWLYSGGKYTRISGFLEPAKTFNLVVTCGSASGDLYNLAGCAIAPDGSLVNRGLLTSVSGGQTVAAQAGQSLSFTVGYKIWQGSNPNEIDQLMFIASWTPSWPPPSGYYWGIYSAVPPGQPGTSGSASFSLTAPSTPGTYYLWFVFDANYGYGQAASDFKTQLSTPAHIKIVVSCGGLFGAVTAYYDVPGASAGATVSLKADVQNTGCMVFTKYPDVQVWFYVTDPSGSGRYVGYVDAGGLAAGSTQTYSYSWTVPSSPATGSYSYKANLWLYQPLPSGGGYKLISDFLTPAKTFAVGYTIQLTSYYDVSNAHPGGTVTLSVDVKNTGASVLPSNAEVWFYVDGPGWQGSHWVGYASIAGLAAGATQTYSISWKIPTSTKVGGYTYWAQAWYSGPYRVASDMLQPGRTFNVT